MSKVWAYLILGIVILMTSFYLISKSQNEKPDQDSTLENQGARDSQNRTDKFDSREPSRRHKSKSARERIPGPGRIDYLNLSEKMNEMSQNERLNFLGGELCAMKSSLGPFADLHGKITLVNEFGGARAGYFRSKILINLFLESDPLKNGPDFEAIEKDLWDEGLREFARQNPRKASEIALSVSDVERQKIGIQNVTSVWLRMDSVAASEAISEMPAGYIRDFAVSEMINYLLKTGSSAEAVHWVETIEDPKIKSQTFQMIKKMTPKGS